MTSISTQSDSHALVQLLHAAWQFRLSPSDPRAALFPEALVWHDAKVPGHVHTDLLSHGLIVDPYINAAEAELQWIGLARWEYRCVFDVDATLAQCRQIELVFEGLDCFAQVMLNGLVLLQAKNAFRRWCVPVADQLRPSGNELCVVFDSPIERILSSVQAMPHQLPGNYPSPFGDEPRNAMTANFVRKPGYQYGWDWGPRLVSCGIWRPVSLRGWDLLCLEELHVQQCQVNQAVAELELQMDVVATEACGPWLKIELCDPEGQPTLHQHVLLQLQAGSNRIALPLRLEQPRRWFPAGMGEQALYTLTVLFFATDGQVLARGRQRVGFRSVELRRHADAHGQEFTFVVNGLEVFAKGANLIPFDLFPNRVSVQAQRRTLEAARAAHMNMLRVWGGGYYECDAFYAMADELGLMVWQDFMFGGGMVPAYDPEFLANVRVEAIEQVRRLRKNACVLLWCGNNEEEWGWQDWGQGSALAENAPAFARQVWDGYVTLFGQVLREVVEQQGGGVPYWSSSPSNDLTGKANDSLRGDKHFWEVWAHSQPVQAYLRETPRFMSEYGLQAWPVQSTIDSVVARAQQSIDGALIRAHQKFLAGDGNQRILHYIRAEYPEPQDFAHFVYLSQQMQADGVALAALHHRASRPQTMGSLYWQLNDVWPGASWSSIDHAGRWKALHFEARRFFAPLTIAALRDEGCSRVLLISDAQATLCGELRMRLLDFNGELLRMDSSAVQLAPQSAQLVWRGSDAELLRGADAKRTVAVYELWVGQQKPARSFLYFAPARELEWPEPGFQVELIDIGDIRCLLISVKRLARGVWIEFEGHDVSLSDNALTLIPGEVCRIDLQSHLDAAQLLASLRLRSLASSMPWRPQIAEFAPSFGDLI